MTTAGSVITHAKSGKTLRYGELAEAAAGRSLSSNPALKARKDYNFIGKDVARLDIPAKVDGSAVYGIDMTLPDMRVATIMMAPVRGGALTSVDPAPALAVAGVEKVIKLDNAVVVIAKGYWQASKGLKALAPQFSDGGHGALSTQSIYDAQAKLNAGGEALAAPSGGKLLTAEYKAPFLHQAMMEPFALVAHAKDGRLDVWGGLQDPLGTRTILAKASGIDREKVMFHPMIMGGGFGRRFPPYSQIVDQIAKIAVQVPYPVKLIWSREQDVIHGAYRPQVSARLQAGLDKDGKIAALALKPTSSTPLPKLMRGTTNTSRTRSMPTGGRSTRASTAFLTRASSMSSRTPQVRIRTSSAAHNCPPDRANLRCSKPSPNAPDGGHRFLLAQDAGLRLSKVSAPLSHRSSKRRWAKTHGRKSVKSGRSSIAAPQ